MWRLEFFNGRPSLYVGFTIGVMALGAALELLSPRNLDKVGVLGAVAIIGTTSVAVANSAGPLRRVESTQEFLE